MEHAWHGTARPSSSDMGANWVRIDGDAHRYVGVSRIGADTSSADTNIYGVGGSCRAEGSTSLLSLAATTLPRDKFI